MKGWFERVIAYGDAYSLTPEGWHEVVVFLTDKYIRGIFR
jgi:hypothetical protein